MQITGMPLLRMRALLPDDKKKQEPVALPLIVQNKLPVVVVLACLQTLAQVTDETTTSFDIVAARASDSYKGTLKHVTGEELSRQQLAALAANTAVDSWPVLGVMVTELASRQTPEKTADMYKGEFTVQGRPVRGGRGGRI
jgi:hypothetical protein